jgi:hypothetical protein
MKNRDDEQQLNPIMEFTDPIDLIRNEVNNNIFNKIDTQLIREIDIISKYSKSKILACILIGILVTICYVLGGWIGNIVFN